MQHGSETERGRLQWRITAATLAVAAHRLDAVERFYRDRLGLPGTRRGHQLRLSLGTAQLSFVAASADSEPFYHFALLVPGNRFEAAHEWLAARVPLLARSGSGETTFEFDFWDASACYAHDPAGSIVELIAHRGIAHSPETGEFDPAELRGISELGLVTDDLLAALRRLRARELELWYGEIRGQRDGFGFVGRQAHTLILCPTGRPWLPTGRPAEPHPLDVAIGNGRGVDVLVRLRDGSIGDQAASL